MGYLYRPMLKGKATGYKPTEEDVVLSRGGTGGGHPPDPEDKRCHHPDHGRADYCRGCLTRFGKMWWMKYYDNGKAVRESTGTPRETEARRRLKEREGRRATGQPILPRADRVRFEETAQDLASHLLSDHGQA